MQKVLFMTTEREDLRSEVVGWGCEDGDKVVDAYYDRSREVGNFARYGHANQIPVGLIRSGNVITYPTVLHALGDGWRLLAPPTSYQEPRFKEDSDVPYIQSFYSWWLVKD